MQRKGNIENFLKKRLDHLENHFQDDWSVFEQKLEKALYLQRLRRMVWMGAFSLMLLGVFVGVNMYQIWGGDLYEPRTRDVYFNEAQKEDNSIATQKVISANHLASESEKGKKDQTGSGLFPPTKSNVTQQVFGSETSGKSQRPNSKGTVSLLSTDAENKIVPRAKTSYPPEASDQTNAGVIAGKTSEANSGKGAMVMTGNNAGQSAEVPDISNLKKKIAEEIKLDRKEPLLISSIEMPKGGLIQEVTQPQLRYNTGQTEGSTAFLNPDMNLRSPIEAVNISGSHGPYVSPLQPQNPWSYSLNVYPNFTFRKFRADEDKFDQLHRDFVDAVQAAESGGFSLNIGFEVSKRIGEITYVNTGVEYISYKTDVAYNFSNFREANINEAGRIIGYTFKDETELISFSDRNIYHYLNFPLSFSYQPWASDHVRLNVELGASFLYFVTARGQTLNYKTLEVIDLSEREYKNYIGSLCFKVGANYYVSPRINIGFEPTIMYFTNTIYTDDYPFYVIPYSVGLNLNLQVKLN
ncbi:MAG: hypothetical protein RLP14_09685 [Owenweeksia sp.]